MTVEEMLAGAELVAKGAMKYVVECGVLRVGDDLEAASVIMKQEVAACLVPEMDDEGKYGDIRAGVLDETIADGVLFSRIVTNCAERIADGRRLPAEGGAA